MAMIQRLSCEQVERPNQAFLQTACQNNDIDLTSPHYTKQVSALPSVRGEIVPYG
jgi:hypothetical protein